MTSHSHRSPTPRPSIVSELSHGRSTRRIYGGVGLSPDDRVVRFLENDPAADSLAPALWSRVNGVPPLTTSLVG